MTTDFRLEKSSLGDAWDRLVTGSANGTLFHLSEYLRALNGHIAVYHCLNNREVRGGLVVAESADGRNAILHDFLIYGGAFFQPPTANQGVSAYRSEVFSITQTIAEHLPCFYSNIQLALHPSVIDIRPFLWVNYGTERPKYIPDVRYTSHVRIEEFATAERLEDLQLYKEASYSRRQEIRYGKKRGVQTITSEDSSLFVEFYRKTMERQNIQVSGETLQEMRLLIDSLLKIGQGRLFVSLTPGGDPGSMAFFAWDRHRAYYLFGANDPLLRDHHTGTAVLWDAFRFLSLLGIREVDLEGVNSPRRGWFKLSFGGSLEPYYQLTYQGGPS